MQEIWKTYMVPITISGAGLLLVLILGIAPLFGQGKKSAEQQTAALTRTLEESQANYAAEIAELRQLVNAQAQTISGFENRLANLDRGVTRTFWRTKEQADFIESLSGANQRLSNLETQMNTLNSAVPRISKRLRDLKNVSQ